jgi:hypothetical protein
MRASGWYAGGARRLGAAVVAGLALLAVGVAWGGGSRPSAPPSGSSGFASSASGPQPVPTLTATPPPLAVRVVRDHLELTPSRLADTAAYSQRHYGVRTTTITPQLIVLHYTETDTYAAARSAFAANLPDHGERPGTCAHYVVDQDGTVYELVPPTVMCRHTIGLNYLAVGIEFVQSSHGHDPSWAARQILSRKAQVQAGVRLVRMLEDRFGIVDDQVIGHAMANDAKAFRDLEGWRNDHVDWGRPEVERFRRLLDAAR